jgi:mRNA-degrading endonuclease YafQ of YafQ-DinJ toxin-antitoxin module
MNPTPVKPYQFTASETFWKHFHALPPEQKELTRVAWAKFKVDPFDPRLRPHKIQALSARAGETILSVEIDHDLRVVFCVRGNLIYTIDIGTHSIYGRG